MFFLSLGTTRILYEYLCIYWHRFLLALVALILSSLSVLFIPVCFRYLIDHGFTDDLPNRAYYFSIVAAVVGITSITIAYRHYQFSWLSERIVSDIRKKLFAHLLSLDAAQYETIKVGEMLSRLTSDTGVVQHILGTSVSMVLRHVIQVGGALAMLFVTSFYLSCVFLLVVPALLFPVYTLLQKMRLSSREGQDKIALSCAYASETLHAIKVSQAFAHEQVDVRQFSQAVECAFDAQRRRVAVRSWMTVAVMIGISGGFLVVCWYGVSLVYAERSLLSHGELLQFVAYALIFSSAVVALSDLVGDLKRVDGAVERLVALMDSHPGIQSPEYPVVPDRPLKGYIKFSNVSFAYPSRSDVLAINDISLSIKPGQHVALVGHSGAGKTTLFQLLQRFYDVGSGQISIDDWPICDLHLTDLRSAMSYVPQDVTIFSGTIYDNIQYGCLDVTSDRVYAAGRLARVDEFVDRLPHGYNTCVGERGLRLSGGQKQRIAIARAFLRDAPILLLDEATSHLDGQNEYLLQQALSRLIRDRTTIVAAHRVSTIQQVDHVVFIHQGRILDQGSHSVLMNRCQQYVQLLQLQPMDA